MIENEVEADVTHCPPLVEHDVFNVARKGVYSGGGVGAGIVVKGHLDERARSRRQGRSRATRGRSEAASLDAGEHTRTLPARRCQRRQPPSVGAAKRRRYCWKPDAGQGAPGDAVSPGGENSNLTL